MASTNEQRMAETMHMSDEEVAARVDVSTRRRESGPREVVEEREPAWWEEGDFEEEESGG